MKIRGYTIRHWIGYWFYTRRANRLALLIKTLGYDVAVSYGCKRNWIHSYDGERVWLAGPGRELP